MQPACLQPEGIWVISMDWRTPVAEVIVGGVSSRDVVMFDVSAFRQHVMATANVELSNVLGEFPNEIKNNDSIVVKTGYADSDLWPVFTGSVLHADNQEIIKLKCQCKNRQLLDTIITRTYQNEEAGAIMRHLLMGLDYTNLNISELRSKLDKLPLVDESIKQAIDAMHQRLNLSHCCYTDASGEFFWNVEDDISADTITIADDDVFAFDSHAGGIYTLDMFGRDIWHSSRIIKAETEYLVMGVAHQFGKNKSGYHCRLWLKEAQSA